MVKPYIDEKLGEKSWLRKFKADTDSSELVWHRDSADREIMVAYGNGWSFQFEDELPFELIEASTFSVPKMTYHRLIKGDGELCVRISENDD